jgi:predicted Zn-dependent protease
LEADNIGMRLATQAGYEPDAAVTLWQKMAKAGGSAPPEFLSTHPAPGNREAQLAGMIPEMRGLNPDGKMAPVSPVEIVR